MHSEEEWARLLTPAQYAVLRQANTERSFTSPLYTVRSYLQEGQAVLCMRARAAPSGARLIMLLITLATSSALLPEPRVCSLAHLVSAAGEHWDALRNGDLSFSFSANVGATRRGFGSR